MFIGALVYGVLTTLFGPRTPPAPQDTRTCFRFHLKGGRVLDIHADTEGLAVRDVLRRQIMLDTIKRMERLS